MWRASVAIVLALTAGCAGDSPEDVAWDRSAKDAFVDRCLALYAADSPAPPGAVPSEDATAAETVRYRSAAAAWSNRPDAASLCTQYVALIATDVADFGADLDCLLDDIYAAIPSGEWDQVGDRCR